MSHDGIGPRAVLRSVAPSLTAGVLTVPALAGCGSEDPAGKPLAGADVADADRSDIADGGTLRWAVDTVPDTLNTFQADADTTTARIAEAVLPSMYRTDGRGRAVRNPDYLASAEVVDTEPKQVVVYKLAQQAVWSDGREIGAADFAAQWRALSGKDTAYWTARNAATTASRRSSGVRTTSRSRSPSTAPTRTGSRCSARSTPRRSWAARTPSTTGRARSSRSPPGRSRWTRWTPRRTRSSSPAIRAGGAARPSSRRSCCAPCRTTSASPRSATAPSTWPRSTPRPPGASRPPPCRRTGTRL